MTGRKPKICIDVETLKQWYLNDRKSTVQIAKELNCDPASVRYLLKKYEINLRNLSESHLSDYNFCGDKDVVWGSLLGDGSILCRNKKTGQGSASFSKANIGYDHIFYVGSEILGEDPSSRIYEYVPKLSQNTTFKFTTLCCDWFSSEYERWYSKGKKIVPKDLLLNKTILLHWFLDDGCSVWKGKARNRCAVSFSTESFSKKECLFLCDQLKQIFGIDAYLSKSHGGHGSKVSLRAHTNTLFFETICCPNEVSSMKYKWKQKLEKK